MKKSYLSLAVISALALLSGCETQQVCDAQGVDVGNTAAPGTPEDFKANIKDRVFFNFNETAITADAHKTLESQAAWLKTYPSTKATVEGHADERGTREYNLALSAKRASAAASTLSSAGVDSTRLATVPYGKDKPTVPNAVTEEQHAQNRVAITVIN